MLEVDSNQDKYFKLNLENLIRYVRIVHKKHKESTEDSPSGYDCLNEMLQQGIITPNLLMEIQTCLLYPELDFEINIKNKPNDNSTRINT